MLVVIRRVLNRILWQMDRFANRLEQFSENVLEFIGTHSNFILFFLFIILLYEVSYNFFIFLPDTCVTVS